MKAFLFARKTLLWTLLVVSLAVLLLDTSDVVHTVESVRCLVTVRGNGMVLSNLVQRGGKEITPISVSELGPVTTTGSFVNHRYVFETPLGLNIPAIDFSRYDCPAWPFLDVLYVSDGKRTHRLPMGKLGTTTFTNGASWCSVSIKSISGWKDTLTDCNSFPSKLVVICASILKPLGLVEL